MKLIGKCYDILFYKRIYLDGNNFYWRLFGMFVANQFTLPTHKLDLKNSYFNSNKD